MPKMDGFQVCSEVRADASLAGVRIIMLTAKGREAEIEKGLSWALMLIFQNPSPPVIW